MKLFFVVDERKTCEAYNFTTDVGDDDDDDETGNEAEVGAKSVTQKGKHGKLMHVNILLCWYLRNKISILKW